MVSMAASCARGAGATMRDAPEPTPRPPGARQGLPGARRTARSAKLSTMASASPTRPAPPLWQVPQIVRGRSPGLGVASAIAAELGLDPLAVRAAFVVLVAANGAGVLLYLAAF